MQYLIDKKINKIKELQILDVVDSFKYLTIIEIQMRENLLIDFQAIIDNIHIVDYKRKLCQYLFKY